MDEIKSPKHYQIKHAKNIGGLEVRHVIENAVELLAGAKSYHHATVLKYMLRAGKKESYWKDIRKAQEHLTFLLELEEGTNEPHGKKKETFPYETDK